MKLISVLQIIVALFLMVAILLQNKGAGLGGIFGGDNSVFRTKRGIEKILFRLTIVLSIIFFAVALANVIFIS